MSEYIHMNIHMNEEMNERKMKEGWSGGGTKTKNEEMKKYRMKE